MLSLIRADVTDRRLPSANLVDLVTRPMAVLVSPGGDGESGAVSHCVVHTVCGGAYSGIVFQGDQDEGLITRGKEEASGEDLRIR